MSIALGLYDHYKGKPYEVIDIALHSETLEEMVVYKALYKSDDYPEGKLWVRSIAMFVQNVEVDGAMVPRFLYKGLSISY